MSSAEKFELFNMPSTQYGPYDEVYAFDIVTGEHLCSQKEVDAHIEAGGHPADIHSLPELLISDELDELSSNAFYSRTLNRISRDECLHYGRWLVAILGDDASLSRNALARAHRLGLGPGVKTLYRPDMFGSLQNLYEAIEAHNARRFGSFKEWEIDDFAQYIRELGQKLGRKPTNADIDEASRRDRHAPSVVIMLDNTKMSLPELYELAGYVDVRCWTRDDYIHWGVTFIHANNGLLPTSKAFDFLSSKSSGPSHKAIISKFGINNYVAKIAEAFLNDQQRLEDNKKTILEQIREITEKGKHNSIPAEIFERDLDEDEMILRYAKYAVMNDLLGSNNMDSKLSIATGRRLKAQDRGFTAAVQQVNSSIEPGDVEVSAASLGLFDIIWPPDYSHLRLPDEFLTPERQKRVRYIKLN
jgi:hypothetical protein